MFIANLATSIITYMTMLCNIFMNKRFTIIIFGAILIMTFTIPITTIQQYIHAQSHEEALAICGDPDSAKTIDAVLEQAECQMDYYENYSGESKAVEEVAAPT
ncbi:MAG: hypothetical protein H0X03_08950, partial [Nitrosopumilus sp.]|nr:hypothetical protein [Nitrosopumilus sp.]